MKGISNCELCECEFHWRRYKTQTKARFCSKKCFYEWNRKNLSAFNEARFQWKTATQEEKREKLKKNYEKYVVRKDGCWEWAGTKDKDGYGQIPVGYHKSGKAHRVAWILQNGEIPKDLKVCHKCDNPPCTNLAHLFIGTTKDNASDMAKKLRGANGTKNKNAKLKESDIPVIRKKLNSGESFYKLADEYKVGPTTIWSIREGKSWKHVEENKCARIERKTRLTKDSVIKIRKLLKIGVKSRRIAQDFGVSPSQICSINKGKSWKHV